jgi:hypothetical protein
VHALPVGLACPAAGLTAARGPGGRLSFSLTTRTLLPHTGAATPVASPTAPARRRTVSTGEWQQKKGGSVRQLGATLTKQDDRHSRSLHPPQPPPLPSPPQSLAPTIRAEGAAPTFANLGAPRGPPNFGQRLLAAAWYIVPALDASALEQPILKFVPALNWVMSFNFPWFGATLRETGGRWMGAHGALATLVAEVSLWAMVMPCGRG